MPGEGLVAEGKAQIAAPPWVGVLGAFMARQSVKSIATRFARGRGLISVRFAISVRFDREAAVAAPRGRRTPSAAMLYSGDAIVYPMPATRPAHGCCALTGQPLSALPVAIRAMAAAVRVLCTSVLESSRFQSDESVRMGAALGL